MDALGDALTIAPRKTVTAHTRARGTMVPDNVPERR